MLEPGDRILLYTDGLLERQCQDASRFGTNRLRASVEQRASSSNERLLAALMADVERFAGDVPSRDDSTALLLEWLPE
jgi:sigma-B regulation protein RsbU (phosphoserine phosphatase)